MILAMLFIMVFKINYACLTRFHRNKITTMLTQPLFIIQLGRLSVRHSNYICQALSSNYTLTFAAFTCSCFN
ncbi:hypothetical protein CYG42_02720 [Lacticaseibacillus rhamnosus]|nr:hypothetical protein DU507_03310 [Lacticaseibacillus rhamnosus GG]AZZ22299.1 hypothetical protein CYG41_03290 [Lacticaseibacillus rhamnosus]PTV10148.1 hypothetical protein DB338_02300 [Lacticaseibacillus rhamnosus]QFG48213.1 hypothetical protein F8M46_03280 [Lacticaseibacillus rhamnosus]RXU54338.1 hypothetical protein CYG42_02720 [Lacticaseibacillus rhamnosus]